MLSGLSRESIVFCGGTTVGRASSDGATLASSGALAYGPLMALDDRPRPGKEPTITPEAKAWLVSLACRKAKELGYPHELWTTRLLARHAREHGAAAGHECLANLSKARCARFSAKRKSSRIRWRYYLERRDAEFEQKMAEVLCVYREVQMLKKAAARRRRRRKKKPGKPGDDRLLRREAGNPGDRYHSTGFARRCIAHEGDFSVVRATGVLVGHDCPACTSNLGHRNHEGIGRR